jgi:hypothetical protein
MMRGEKLMAKLLLTATDLAALVLVELRKVPHCEEASHIDIRGLADDRVSETWEVSHFNAGKSGIESCERALSTIVPRLQALYDLACPVCLGGLVGPTGDIKPAAAYPPSPPCPECGGTGRAR